MPNDATLMLQQLQEGDGSAAQRLLPLVYEELRALAGSHFRHQRADHTLQPTALVHEAFVRLIKAPDGQWKNRSHFFAVAATAMRQILTDHARRKKADKRGGAGEKIGLDQALGAANDEKDIDIVALDEALTKLATLDARKHRVVELRFFGGLSMEEIAEVLEVSKTTIETDWRGARAWLATEMSKE